MKRHRITVTLQPSLVKEIDKAVDGRHIKSRSHAVELALAKAYLSRPVKVLILAGGRQIRPAASGREIPKGLLPVHGRPLLEHTVLRLKSSGLENMVI